MKKITMVMLGILLVMNMMVSAAMLVDSSISITKARKDALDNYGLTDITYQEIDTNGDGIVMICISQEGLIQRRCSNELYRNATIIKQIKEAMINDLADDIIDAQPVETVIKEGDIIITQK